MHLSKTTVRRGLFGMFAGGALACGSPAIVLPTANAQPNPCTASSIANTVSSVSASTSSYLASHPEVNQELTDISQLPADQALVSYEAYFADNPQVETDLEAIQQPVADLSSRCGLEVTPTPVVEALQAL